jgi:anti-sigma factor RsiW
VSEEVTRLQEEDLVAYVDGELSTARSVEVAALLASDPAAAAAVSAYRAQNEALKALLAPVLREPVPRRLTAAARGLSARPAPGYAALAASLAAGIALGWWLRGEGSRGVPPSAALPHSAAIAHAVYTPEVLHPVEVAAEQEAHLVKWLTRRLGVAVKPPDLSARGYALVGGRLLPGSERPAAQFMYQDETGQRLTLYVRTDVGENRETAFRYAHEAGLGVFYWIDGPVGYALVGPYERESLLGVAEVVYHQLSP